VTGGKNGTKQTLFNRGQLSIETFFQPIFSIFQAFCLELAGKKLRLKASPD